MTTTPALEKGLPANVDAERFVLGSILLDDAFYPQVVGALESDDFSLEKHRRIFKRMGDLYGRGERIDRVTIANELMKTGEFESCDGLNYLVSLDDGLPLVSNIDSYVHIVEEKSLLRRTIFACQHMMNRCLMGEEGAADLLLAAERTVAALAEKSSNRTDHWVSGGDVMFKASGGIQAFLSPVRNGMGIPMPWKGLTECFCGLHTGDLFVVAGRPSMGKSIVAAELAHTAAKHGSGAGIVSLEMSKEDIMRRLVASHGRIDCQRLRQGYCNAEERRRAAEATSALQDLPLWIDDAGARTTPAITAAARKLMARSSGALKVLVVDHLQLMKGTSQRNEQKRNDELSEVCHSLKHIAREMGIVSVLVSQLNRQCEIENRRPQLSDLKETGSLEEDADEVLFVHRPERYARNHDREDLRGVAEFIVAKQRVGPIGLKQMVFLANMQRFEEQAYGQEGLEAL